ncbi:hypothetical protein M6B38_362650 [Iris pallida]|uniref:Uncharacterized protein n=1 Tax=Iris pallida TaxID=29817 RepID=A0AAX6GJW7_IRIPA|nr:hypothetical protein M6B38_362650 [Iris pallida]
MYSCTYSCTYPSRSHRLVVFQALCICHGLYLRFMVYILYFISYTYIPVLSCSFLYFRFYVLLYAFPYHDVFVYYLEQYFAPLLVGYVAGEMEAV